VVAFLPGRAGIFLSLAVSFGVSVAILGFVLIPRALPGYLPRPELRVEKIRPILRFSLGNYAAIAISAAGTLLPTPLIYDVLGPTEGPKNAAYFYVALIVASLLYIIPGAAFTSFYAEASHGNTDRRRGERQAILLSVGLLIPAIAGMWLFSDWVLRLFGDPAYADEAVTPLRILTIASIPAFLNGILGTRIRVRKRTLPLIVAATIAASITLGLGWVLLQNPDLGIDGIAYAYVLGQAAATPYLYTQAREAYESMPTEPLVGQPLE
jgi:O-antigen/teichoic acid export membrane protein